MKLIKVIPAAGVEVPIEGDLKKSYPAAVASEVPATAYIKRRIADGDLVLVRSKSTKKGAQDGE